jgi:hypothetical protein
MKNKKQENKKGRFNHWYLLQDTDGKKSISFTMVFYGFLAVTLWLVLSMTEELSGLKIRQFSGSESMAYLAPIFAIYFGRKHQVSQTSGGTTNSTTTEDSTENEEEGQPSA